MTEQQPYDVVEQRDGWELRRYPAHVLAETVVRGASFEDAGNRAFRLLVGYIGGDNAGRRSIDMTAPVVQSPEKIAMTAPVIQERDGEDFVVAFVLPAEFTETDAPAPTNPEVRLRTVPEQLVAALRFSGRWTRESWDRHRDELLAGVRDAGLTVEGEPRFARFDPPIMPSFLRHNEVQVEVRGQT
ncbi:heme-binding protein [Microbacterium sp. 4R-513]|uniref:SOUL family heme-binding protein n=1 Tax=Microbacterium sp. 4R-513 TaxID=2567934 RepID=UPI0013E202A1|nr:heme-binding protein [Microbacterium sp. 4R-513]QIG40040.1 heme-binding protein [Microbacterium sp. 4R-513]